MWSLLLLLCFTCIEPVVLQEDNRLILRDGGGPCEGYIQVYYNKQWGFVGDKGWNKNAEKVVCGSIDCGEPIESKNMLLSQKRLIGLNELNCKGHEKNLWSCDEMGWTISQAPTQTVKWIKCSNHINIKLDRFKCSGSVQYSINGMEPHYFCGDNWGDDEASVVCTSLQCGRPTKEHHNRPMRTEMRTNMKVVKCLSNMTNLWQCVQEQASCQKPASVTCADHEVMRLDSDPSNVCSGTVEIQKEHEWTRVMSNKKSMDPKGWCKNMFCGDFVSIRNVSNAAYLTCSDKVNIALRDGNKNSKCYGSVQIQRNESFYHICASEGSWTQKNAQVVCSELNCGTVVRTDRRVASMGIMDSVNCTGDESSLWHCKAQRDAEPFRCTSEPYVICSGSVHARLNDGPGRCAGRVEIHYEGEWRKVMIKKRSDWSNPSSTVVCRHLGCGDVRSTSEKFSQAKATPAMLKTVKCTDASDHISKCIRDLPYQSSNSDSEVGLVCTEHKVFYLDGDTSCSGLVGVQHGDANYWLSGSGGMWNQTYADLVCGELSCGNASDFSTVNPNTTGSIWHPDPSCSSKYKDKHNPLLDCGTSASINASHPVARVTCSGNKTMTLTNKCWGNVNICVEDGCGGVCADSWTKSEKLCKDQKCGIPVQSAANPVTKFKAMFKSVHFAEEGGNLSKSSFVRNDGSACESARVVCSGSLKPQLNSRDVCSGKVEVNYENQWRPVCGDALKDESIQTLFCKKLDCGTAVQSFDYYKRSSSNGISKMTCENQENQHKNLTECSSFEKKSCTYGGGLQCSKWKKMALATGDACKGVVVVVYSEGVKKTVSYDGWTDKNAERLCKDLDCGGLSKSGPYNLIKGSEFWHTTFNCTGGENEANIWDCEKQESPRGKELVYVECTDEPKVKLEKGCHGNVTINGVQVCNTFWSDTYSALVCQELGYSNAIFGNFNNSLPEPGKNYYHVRCEEHHHKIGQCERVLGPCSRNLASVYCTQNVTFTTSKKCGGQIEVSYGTEFGGKVCYDNKLYLKHKERFCEQLQGCGKAIHNPKETKPETPPEDIKQWGTVLRCSGGEKYPRYCLFRESCAGKQPAEVYCEGYKPDDTTKPIDRKVNVPAVILGVGLFLILMIVIFVFVRVYIVRKHKNVKNFLPGFALRNDVESDSGEFEEIPPKEMDDMRSGGIRSESEAVAENDARSTCSLSYDDIDEVSELQPLAFQPPTIDDPQDSGVQDNKEEQNAKEDGVTYEVDDPQENYDDIEAGVDPPQTTAEVHESPRTAPECSTNAPPDLVLGDDDYLVPGQDG